MTTTTLESRPNVKVRVDPAETITLLAARPDLRDLPALAPAVDVALRWNA